MGGAGRDWLHASPRITSSQNPSHQPAIARFISCNKSSPPPIPIPPPTLRSTNSFHKLLLDTTSRHYNYTTSIKCN